MTVGSKKRNVGILIYDDVEVLDFAGPFEVFSVASQVHDHSLHHTFTVAKHKVPVSAVNGLSVNPTYSLRDVPSIDLLVIAGGSGSRPLLEDEITLNWVRNAQRHAEITMSICSGARVLAAIGLLDGQPYCTHDEVYDHLASLVKKGKPQKEQRFVEAQKNVFTSGGISAGIDLSFHVLGLLYGRDVVEKTANYMEYELTRARFG